MFKNTTIKTKLFLNSVLMVVGSIVVIGTVYNSLINLQNTYNQSQNLQAQTGQLKSMFIGGLLFNSAKGVVDKNINAKKAINAMGIGIKQINESHKKLLKTNTKLANSMQSGLKNFNTIANKMVNDAKSGKPFLASDMKESLAIWRGLKKQIQSPLKPLQNKVEQEREHYQELVSSTITTMIILAVAAVIVLFAIATLISRGINKSLNQFDEYLNGFFDYINGKASDVKELTIDSVDEIGNMARVVEKNAQQSKNGLEQDRELIAEFENVIEKVNNGFYMYQVKGSASNPGVESLKNTINDMINQTNDQINTIVTTLTEYGKSNFNYEMPKRDDMNGSFGSLLASTKLIGDNISEILAMVMSSGEQLNVDTEILSKSATDLSTSSNNATSSLEETSVALKEMTGNIRSNTDNVVKMSSYASSLSQSSDEGRALASVKLQNLWKR